MWSNDPVLNFNNHKNLTIILVSIFNNILLINDT